LDRFRLDFSHQSLLAEFNEELLGQVHFKAVEAEQILLYLFLLGFIFHVHVGVLKHIEAGVPLCFLGGVKCEGFLLF